MTNIELDAALKLDGLARAEAIVALSDKYFSHLAPIQSMNAVQDRLNRRTRELRKQTAAL